MYRILITGGAGFIGSNFVHYCHEQHGDWEITILDALTYAGNKDSIQLLENQTNIEFVHGDICEEELVNKVLRTREIDSIIHFAAESHVDRSILGPDAFIQTNIVGTHTLLKCAKQYWLDESNYRENHKFHHVSTDEVFGTLGFDDAAFQETTPYDPSSPYSASKAASDHLVRAYQCTYGLNTTISNCSNNYGPYHFPEKLIPLTILNILHGRPIPIYGKGENVRDWLFVSDHCSAIDLILRDGKTGETYNIGGNCELTNMEVVNYICEAVDQLFSTNGDLTTRFPLCPASKTTKCSKLITYVKDRAGHDLRYAMNINKIERELGFKPSETFDSGIKKTIQWYLDNEDWWLPLLDDSYKDWLSVQYGG